MCLGDFIALFPIDITTFLGALFPFLISSTIFFALLQKSRIFGEGGSARRINGLLAISISLYIVLFSPLRLELAAFFLNLLSGGLAVVVSLIFFMFITLMIGLVRGEEKIGWATIIVGAVLTLIVIAPTGMLNLVLGRLPETVMELPWSELLFVTFLIAAIYLLWHLFTAEARKT
jgi:hypothetical protein